MLKQHIQNTAEFERLISLCNKHPHIARSDAWSYGAYFKHENSTEALIESWCHGFIYRDEENNPENFPYRLRVNFDDTLKEEFYQTHEEALLVFNLAVDLIQEEKKVWEIGEILNLKTW